MRLLYRSGPAYQYCISKCMFYYTLYVLSLQIGETPLYEASRNGHTDVVRILMENKADPNISDEVRPFYMRCPLAT